MDFYSQSKHLYFPLFSHSPNNNKQKMGIHDEHNKNPQPISKPFDFFFSINNLFTILFFVFGLTLGFIICLWFKSFPLNLQSSINPFIDHPPFLPNSTSNVDSNLTQSKNNSLMHNMSDQELFFKVSRIEEFQKVGRKVCFMFLTKGPLPLRPLWEKFFNGHQDLYSIYVHTHPLYEEIVPEDSVFYGRRIPSQPVFWGTSSMVDAERRLLANALLDSRNLRFVLLSESCIPLFNFTTSYNYLTNSNYSFISSYDDPRKSGRGRYNPQMWPNINITDWRKGSQWFEIHRNVALNIVMDTKYYDIFVQQCLPPCYMDEHYIPTLVNMLYPEMNSNRSVTWVDWSRGGPHPRKFGWADITDEFLNSVRFGSECDYYESSSNNNGSVISRSICFLFGRKFVPNSLEPLLKISPLLLGFDP